MKESYENPLITRYASKEMSYLFSPDMRYTTWRKLWIALAEAEMELGLPITKPQVDELKAHITPIDYDAVATRERQTRHDVMAHIYAYGLLCPGAKGIIHLGATSCYVTDNADIMIMKDALVLVRKKLVETIRRLAVFAGETADIPTLGFTHLQPAQPVTVGKRACLWIQDLMLDLEDLDYAIASLKPLGCKGTTGTQASFLELFDNDAAKVYELETRILKKIGFSAAFEVTGQTYPRKVDSRILSVLSGIAQSAYKFAADLRVLQSRQEIEEPFESGQVGSSAMAYKRNPMRSERICSLSRHVTALVQDASMTQCAQFFERTLDDSAIRRIALPEAFLAIDAVLELLANVANGLVVYPRVIEKNLREKLPFMLTENILMEAVKRGGDRQELHEKIRTYSQEASKRVKLDGLPDGLLDDISADPAFSITREELETLMEPALYVGLAPEQVRNYLGGTVKAALESEPPQAIGNIKV